MLNMYSTSESFCVTCATLSLKNALNPANIYCKRQRACPSAGLAVCGGLSDHMILKKATATRTVGFTCAIFGLRRGGDSSDSTCAKKNKQTKKTKVRVCFIGLSSR